MRNKIIKIVILIMLLIAAYNIVQFFAIQNIFDEMYYASDDVYRGLLTPTSWRDMDLVYMIDETKYAVPGSTYNQFDLIKEDESLIVCWTFQSRELRFGYHRAFEENNERVWYYVFLNYLCDKNELIVEPMRLLGNKDIEQVDASSINDNDLLRENCYQTLQYATDVMQQYVIDKWRLANPNTKYDKDLGMVKIIDNTGIPFTSEIFSLQ